MIKNIREVDKEYPKNILNWSGINFWHFGGTNVKIELFWAMIHLSKKAEPNGSFSSISSKVLNSHFKGLRVIKEGQSNLAGND